MSRVRTAGPPSLMAKNFNVRRYMHSFRPNCFIPAMRAGTIDFRHFMRLSLILTLTGSHKVSAKQNLSCAFQLIRMKIDMASKYFKSNILIILLSEINETDCFTDCIETSTTTTTADVRMHSDVYESILRKLDMIIDTIKLLILILV